MRKMVHSFKAVAILALTCLVGSLPSCGTMGGGGMKYLVDPPGVTRDTA
jgi:hypothetical protein